MGNPRNRVNSKSRERLSGLRLSRRSAIESVDQQIRAAFARASGAYANIGLAEQQEAAARKNYEYQNTIQASKSSVNLHDVTRPWA